jgi:hypothetical protein
MDLPEDLVLILAVHGTPCTDAPFQSPTNSHSKFWMTSQHLVIKRHRSNARRRLKDRHNFSVKYVDEWIGTRPLAG